MSLRKLTIKHEEKKEGVFSGEAVALFNPNKLSYQRSVSWQTVDPAALSKSGRRSRLQFQSIVPETLSLELFFDTYEPVSSAADLIGSLVGSLLPDKAVPPDPQSVLELTEPFEALASYEADLHRPPVCQLTWGENYVLFTGVLTQMSKTLDLFHRDGTPLRATMQCTFTDIRSTDELHSPDVAKTYVVKPRDTLLQIAAEHYADASLWRVIAEANGIDNPRVLTPGRLLAIPALQ
ncbi:hypothetical protein A7982_13686 [Minicystis rosea]|nr:hypothetical protein A7982_13686 [Minicystis rosea]